MSSREPLWFCHECHAEMRPLMVPDPVCASCHGSFVEKMENAADDPRQFSTDDDILGGFHRHHNEEGGGGVPNPGVDALLLSLQTLMDRGMGSPNGHTQRTNAGPAVSFELRGPGGGRTLRFGGPNTLGRRRNSDGTSGPDSTDDAPNMTTFTRMSPFGPPMFGGPEDDRPSISGPLMAQYLMALLGHTEPGMFGMPENGRMGDYVYNQEALDQIISQIMENSNAHRPVPATEEIIAKLPREVLVEGSPMLEQDCAVCKEQFALGTEDPDEQVVVTLPCRHPFHQPCILPWLTSSGTCPVCRYALVPQPEHHPSPNRPAGPNSGDDRSRSPPRPSPNHSSGPSGSANSTTRRGSEGSGGGGGGGGLMQSLFSGLAGLAHPNQTHNNNNNPSNTRRNDTSHSPPRRETGRRTPRSTSPHPPQQASHWPHAPRANSDPASRSSPSSPSSSGNRNRHQSQNQNHRSGSRNVPGSWTDELD